MSDEKKTKIDDVRPSGVVFVPTSGSAEGVPFVVGALPLSQERRLIKLLSAKAKAAVGTYYSRLAPLLASATGADRTTILHRIVDLDASGDVYNEDFENYRASTDGVRFELFYRASKFDSAVTQQQVDAVINDFNAQDVHDQILEAITRKVGEEGKPPTA